MKIILCFVCICIVRYWFVQGVDLEKFPMVHDETSLSAKYFEIMNIYYTTVFTVTIHDQMERGDTVKRIYQCSFEYLDTTLIHNLLKIEEKASVFTSETHGNNQNISYLMNSKSKIIINKRNSVGNLFILKNIDSLTYLMRNKTFIDRVQDETTVSLIKGHCHEQEFQKLSNLLKTLWHEYGILHQIILFPKCELVSFFDILSHDQRTNTWGQASFINITDVVFIPSLFTDYYKDLKGYPIRVSIFTRYPTSVKSRTVKDLFMPSYLREVGNQLKLNGIDPIILYNTFTLLNFTPVMQKESYAYYGHRAPNGSYVGTLGYVIHNETDISFNGRYLKDYEAEEYIDFLKPTSFDKICFLTPKAIKNPRLKAQLFKTKALIALLILIVAISCLWRCLTKYVRHNGKIFDTIQPISFIMLEFCMMLLSAISAKMPRNSVERQFVAGLLLGAWYFSGIFQAALSTAMSTITFDKDINTFKQLVDSELPIYCVSRSLKDFLGENQSSLIESLRHRFHVHDFNTSLLGMTAYYRNVSCIERASDAKIIIRRWHTTALVHIMKNCLRFFYISYIVRKNYQFTEDLNRIFGRYQEAGLIEQWYEEMMEAMSHYKGDIKVSSNLPEACTLMNLSFYFHMILIGYGAGACVLILELCVSRKRRIVRPH